MRHLPNILTISRILGAVALLFLQPLSGTFLLVYALCGISDMVDGAIARRFSLASEFGAKLDGIADLVFVAVALVKILSVVELPLWGWCWIAGIAAIKLCSLWMANKHHLFEALHTIANKVVGFTLFVSVFALNHIPTEMLCFILCALGTGAAIQELHLVRRG